MDKISIKEIKQMNKFMTRRAAEATAFVLKKAHEAGVLDDMDGKSVKEYLIQVGVIYMQENALISAEDAIFLKDKLIDAMDSKNEDSENKAA